MKPATTEYFYSRKDRKTKIVAACKECQSLLQSAYIFEALNIELNDDIKNKIRTLRHNFGMTIEEYKSLHDKQQGLCAICKRPENRSYKGKVKRLSVDHCHTTLKIRQLLCSDCNTSLGLMEDDPDRLRRAADYVERHRS